MLDKLLSYIVIVLYIKPGKIPKISFLNKDKALPLSCMFDMVFRAPYNSPSSRSSLTRLLYSSYYKKVSRIKILYSYIVHRASTNKESLYKASIFEGLRLNT